MQIDITLRTMACKSLSAQMVSSVEHLVIFFADPENPRRINSFFIYIYISPKLSLRLILKFFAFSICFNAKLRDGGN